MFQRYLVESGLDNYSFLQVWSASSYDQPDVNMIGVGGLTRCEMLRVVEDGQFFRNRRDLVGLERKQKLA